MYSQKFNKSLKININAPWVQWKFEIHDLEQRFVVLLNITHPPAHCFEK